ncbi:hypothetical protein GQ607_003341 [Colletotrichum asianum]|uniref:Uncharacterized protein n=1 Tax=Colletotrichum asianum TaxID=702518 RepID=A0A8H3ZVL5_9PEZI|nr:hypothetical protein GQ607_003341 [Colletotrichum asianum]
MSELDRNLYTVAWIAPLYIEAKAALLMLDQKHRGQFAVSRGDDYVFHAGSMCGHNIVIATLPAGQEYGTGSAAALASQVRKSFPNLWFSLLVGVAAGLPNLSRRPRRDIRLGDVLVALPEGETAGLVAYDLGKDIGDDGFRPLRLGNVLAQTETIVRSAIGKIRLHAPHESEVFFPFYKKIRNEQHEAGNFKDPGQNNDTYYEFDQHGGEYTVMRERRSTHRRTRVWYGPIGSGEKLMRNFRQRNQLRDKYDLVGLEMEAAGTMKCIPVGVIRGVCDYGDEHKNKEWQPYAAAMAAAYAKAVLQEILPDRQDEVLFSSDGQSANYSGRGVDSIQQDHFLSQYLSSMPSRCAKRRHIADELDSDLEGGLYKSSSDRRRSRRYNSLPFGSASSSENVETSNTRWPEYQTERPPLSANYLDRSDTPPQLLPGSEIWRTVNRRTPWTVFVYGLSGVGKSQMCLKAILEQQHRFRGVFYIDASDRAIAYSNYVEISRACEAQHHWEGISVDERIRITRAWLASQNEPWLLMIDNMDSYHIQQYLPSGGCGTILITSNNATWATGYHTQIPRNTSMPMKFDWPELSQFKSSVVCL